MLASRTFGVLLVARHTCRALVPRARPAVGHIGAPRFAGSDAPAPTWGALGLTADLVGACANLGLEAPSEIQRLTIPAVCAGEDLLFAAETGSGKTLAYLLPAVSKLKAEEFAAADVASLRPERRPRALVLVPTRELGAQVLAVAKDLAHAAKVGVRGATGGSDGVGAQRKRLAGAYDVLVATPGRFLKLWELGAVHVTRVNVVVVDEVDTMLSQGFGADLETILGAVARDDRARHPPAQVVATTATLTKAVRSTFGDRSGRAAEWRFLPELRVVESANLHKSVATATHATVDVVGRDKLDALANVLGARRDKTLVFCNTVASCRAAEAFLRERAAGDPDALFCYHGAMNSRAREAALAAFRDAPRGAGVLVATDLAARGLDVADVGHVVMFDFPRNPVDYLHRAGRTARAGDAGRVTSLVAKADRVLAAAVSRAIRDGAPLDELSSSRRDYAPGGTHAPAAKPGSPKARARRDLDRAKRGAAPPRRKRTRRS